jgi:hypothetical protein
MPLDSFFPNEINREGKGTSVGVAVGGGSVAVAVGGAGVGVATLGVGVEALGVVHATAMNTINM